MVKNVLERDIFLISYFERISESVGSSHGLSFDLVISCFIL